MARIKAIEARLHVGDLRRSLAFYTETLGFKADALIPENSPEFAILSRDGIGLQLVRSPAPTMGRAKDAGCTLWVDVEDVRRLHEAIRTRAVVEWARKCMPTAAASSPSATPTATSSSSPRKPTTR